MKKNNIQRGAPFMHVHRMEKIMPNVRFGLAPNCKRHRATVSFATTFHVNCFVLESGSPFLCVHVCKTPILTLSTQPTPNPMDNSNSEGGINFDRLATVDKNKEITQNHKREEKALNDKNKQLLAQIRLMLAEIKTEILN